MSELKEHGIIHSESQGLIDAAYRFAKHHHGDQKRKYTGEPYINHPVEVAKIVQSVTQDCNMISAALLHDVLEDTSATRADLIEYGFGFMIADLVDQLTDVSKPSDGNRKVRKAMDRNHLAHSSNDGATIKLADLISNSKSIAEHDPEFAKVYMAEKHMLLCTLSHGNKELHNRATLIVRAYYGALESVK